MIEGILGKKLGMTRIFIEGASVPATVIQTGCRVTQRKTKAKDGYDAVQLGFLEKKEKRTSRALMGHFKKCGTPAFYHLKEFRGENLDEYKPGKTVAVAEVFKVGDYVDVSGVSKGKGFAGVMKRWHFRGGPGSHGSMFNRAPGSIGSSSYPSRVFKGMRMGGHMGCRGATVENLKVVDIEDNIVLIKGAVPGAVNSVVIIRKAAKK
jgi:large subunit ribosomal protein L3